MLYFSIVLIACNIIVGVANAALAAYAKAYYKNLSTIRRTAAA